MTVNNPRKIRRLKIRRLSFIEHLLMLGTVRGA